MKNLLAATLMALFSFTFLQAQEGFKIEIQGGLPFNDFNTDVSLAIGLDVGYMRAINPTFDLGATVGYIHGIPETFHSEVVLTDLPTIQFVPLAGSVRIWPSRSISFGIDAGHALGLNEGNDGGLYYRPTVGFLFGTSTEINLSYTSIGVGDRDWTTVTLGIEYTFLNDRFN